MQLISYGSLHSHGQDVLTQLHECKPSDTKPAKINAAAARKSVAATSAPCKLLDRS